MCMNQNELPKHETGNEKQSKQPDKIMISDLLTAISENEYPQYILEAIEKVRAWINKALNHVTNEDDENADTFTEFFGTEFDEEEESIEELFEELKSLAQYADVIPGANKNNNKEDTIIVSLAPPDYDSGLRAAIDCAAVFHRPHCKRVWLLSDTFIFNEIIKYIPHVDALNEQGITLRFILITPWGWVELPLSEMTVNKRQFLWRTENINKTENKIKRRRKK